MSKIAQFTTADGRRVGVPSLGGVLLMNVEGEVPDRPEGAKTLIRYIAGGNVMVAWVRDPLKHVLSAMSLSAQGAWAHCTDANGADVALPKNTIIAYEEVSDDLMVATLNVPGPPVSIRLKTSYEDMVKHIGLEGAAEPAEEAENGGDTGEDSIVAERRGATVGRERSDQDRQPRRGKRGHRD
jgi:hypothetical protein